MVFKMLSVLVLCMKVASALEGLKYKLNVDYNNTNNNNNTNNTNNNNNNNNNNNKHLLPGLLVDSTD